MSPFISLITLVATDEDFRAHLLNDANAALKSRDLALGKEDQAMLPFLLKAISKIGLDLGPVPQITWYYGLTPSSEASIL